MYYFSYINPLQTGVEYVMIEITKGLEMLKAFLPMLRPNKTTPLTKSPCGIKELGGAATANGFASFRVA